MPEKILVVDDESNIRNLAKMILEGEGYHVLTASDGDEALQKAESEMPDLIFLDLRMPGKNGSEVCKILKSQAKTKSIPVIIFTASSYDFDKTVAEAGADGYFRKPFLTEPLIAETKKRLEQAKAR